MIIIGRNVNDIYAEGVMFLRAHGSPDTSRAGEVLVADTPVLSVYRCPTERVLFDRSRRANPFFHLMEALWMLGGRDDAAFLNKFVGDFGDRFANGGRLLGAYGKRWRNHFVHESDVTTGYEHLTLDQLAMAVERLKRDKKSRQVVIAMWDPSGTDNETGEVDGEQVKDRCCNTHIYLRVKEHPHGYPSRQVLDLTVCCRSNDIIWGAYGANAVHFSMLQEYLAGRIGVEVGTMYQFSNNYHAYTDALDKVGAPDDEEWYNTVGVAPMPIGVNFEEWDVDLREFLAFADSFAVDGESPRTSYVNDWFKDVAENMLVSHAFYRANDISTALRVTERIAAVDWRIACKRWLEGTKLYRDVRSS